MALVNLNKSFIGVARRADECLGKRDDWFPQSYVRVDIEGVSGFNLSPSAAKQLAKALKSAADLVEPPVSRRRS